MNQSNQKSDLFECDKNCLVSRTKHRKCREQDRHDEGRRSGAGGEEAALQAGSQLVASGYALYSSATMVVATLGGGRAAAFTLDATTGDFLATHPTLRVPPRGMGSFCGMGKIIGSLWLSVNDGDRPNNLIPARPWPCLRCPLCWAPHARPGPRPNTQIHPSNTGRVLFYW